MWFVLKLDENDVPSVVSNLYVTQDEAMEYILPKIFNELWEIQEEVLHYRGGGGKINDHPSYINGLYPVYNSGFLLYYTRNDMISMFKNSHVEMSDNIKYYLMNVD